MRQLYSVVLLASAVACGGDDGPSGSPTSPSGTTMSVAVTVSSPIRMGQTAQASGTESLSNGQTRPVTSGWLSDAPGVATVTNAGLVTGISNGRATVYVVTGGGQGQQVVRVVPDYQGQWSGGLLVTSCTQTGIFQQIGFCDEFPSGFTSEFLLNLAQSGELMTATVNYGLSAVFPGVAAPVREDGTSVFTSTVGITEEGITLTIDAGFGINSTRVGELTGTVNEIWRVPNVSGEGRLAQNIVSTTRTSTTTLGTSRDGASSKLRLLRKLSR
jgi:Bacterial Ig-like domain (group 2)